MRTFLFLTTWTFLFLSIIWSKDGWFNFFLKMWFIVLCVASAYWLAINAGIIFINGK